jgi:hypothetical protein
MPVGCQYALCVVATTSVSSCVCEFRLVTCQRATTNVAHISILSLPRFDESLCNQVGGKAPPANPDPTPNLHPKGKHTWVLLGSLPIHGLRKAL